MGEQGWGLGEQGWDLGEQGWGLGEQGWRRMGRALASHQCGPGSNPGDDAICELSLLLVLSFAPRGLSPGTPPVFLSLKNQIPIRSGTHGHVSKSSEQLPSAPWVKKTNYSSKRLLFTKRINAEKYLRAYSVYICAAHVQYQPGDQDCGLLQ